MKRVASVIGLPPDHREEYERHHAAVWPGVLARLTASHIHNYSIYRHGDLLFSYFEYTGDDLDADLASIAADPVTREWWTHTEPCQRPLTEGTGGPWTDMTEVWHLD